MGHAIVCAEPFEVLGGARRGLSVADPKHRRLIMELVGADEGSKDVIHTRDKDDRDEDWELEDLDKETPARLRPG